MRRTTPARARARTFLDRVLLSHVRGQSHRLPTIRRLSQQAGVSYVSMWHAVRSLADAGVLTVSHRSGITISERYAADPTRFAAHARVRSFYGPEGKRRLPTVAELAELTGTPVATLRKMLARLADSGIFLLAQGTGESAMPIAMSLAARQEEPGTPARAARWRAVAERIEADIQKGRYRLGALLPTLKELGAAYGVSYRTLRKACDALEQRGRVSPQNRTYRVVGIAGRQHRHSVALVASGDRMGGLLLPTWQARDFVRKLETECSRMDLTLSIYPTDYVDNKLRVAGHRTSLFARLPQTDDILGFIVVPRGIGRSLSDLVYQLSRAERPVSVLQESNPIHMPLRPVPGASIRVTAIAEDVQAGMQAGRFLADLGHRHIAYVSPVHGLPWSTARLEGLRSVFEEGGLSGSVFASVSENSQTLSHSRRRLLVENALRALEELTLASEGTGTAPGILERTQGKLLQQAAPLLDSIELQQAAHPLVETVLERREVTAVVACNDDVGMACLEVIVGSGRRVPDDLSVLSFDDSLEAFAQGLSSYNFNTPMAVQSLLDNIVAPARLPPPNRGFRTQSIDGFVTARRTTASAR
jgi:DNA-binding GntR family transcriptional regulator